MRAVIWSTAVYDLKHKRLADVEDFQGNAVVKAIPIVKLLTPVLSNTSILSSANSPPP